MQRKEYIPSLSAKWSATLDDGSFLEESNDILWSSYKERVTHLKLVDDIGNVIITLPTGMKKYLQGKTGSCGLIGGKVLIESRWIGFEDENGRIFKIRRNEANGELSVEA